MMAMFALRGDKIGAGPAGDEDADVGFHRRITLEGFRDELCELRCGVRQLEADLMRRAEQPADMVLDEDHLPVVGPHEIEATVSAQQAQIVEGQHRFRFPNEFSVHVIDIFHKQLSSGMRRLGNRLRVL